MPETYTQMKTRRWEEAGECCEVCKAYVSRDKVQIHHVLHQAQHPHLVQAEINCVIICWMCHRLDEVTDPGEEHTRLRRILIRQKGQEWYERLISKREVHHA